MAKRRKALERQKKENSAKAKAKRAKKAYYQSPAAKQKWEEKKAKKAKKAAETYGYTAEW